MLTQISKRLRKIQIHYHRDFPGDLDLFRAALRCVIPERTLHIEADNGVYIAKRSNEDTEVYFLCNDGSDAARVCIDALPGMRILNPDTGTEAAYTVRDGRISLNLAGLEMLAIIRDKACSVMPESTYAPLPAARELVLDEPYAFSVNGGNCLPLNYEMYDPDLQEWVRCEFMHFAPEIHMLPEDPYRLRARVQIDRKTGDAHDLGIEEKLLRHTEQTLPSVSTPVAGHPMITPWT